MMQPLRNMFNNEEKESITRQEIRDGLAKLLKSNLDDYREMTDNLKAEQSEVMKKSGCEYVRSYIQDAYAKLIEQMERYEADPDNKANQMQNPFEELSSFINEFFANEELINEFTLIAGDDIQTLVEIVQFLAQQIENRREDLHKTGLFVGNKAKSFKTKYE